LHLRRHQRPSASQAGGAVADAAVMTPARAARTTAPQRQRLAIEAADRRERRIALRLLSLGRHCIQIAASPAPRSLSSSKCGHLQPSCLCPVARTTGAKKKQAQSFSRRPCARVLQTNFSALPQKAREAARRQAQLQCPRHTSGRYRPDVLRARQRATNGSLARTVCFRARSPLGAPPRLLSRQPNAKDSGPGRASRDADAKALPPLCAALKPGTWHAGRDAGGVDARTRPGAGLRTPPAGTAPAPLQGSSREASLVIRRAG
jgi:hypothetical protein